MFSLLLRLVKEPEKLKQAVAIALKGNPSPSVSDFAAAANVVVPQLPRKKHIVQEPMVPKIEEPVVPKKAIVTVSQQSHPRYEMREPLRQTHQIAGNILSLLLMARGC